MCVDDDTCCCSSVILGIIFGIFALIGLLCMTAGYVNNRNKNGNLVPATCQTISSETLPDSCYKSCCYFDSDGECVGCTYTCYSGYVKAAVENITAGSVLKVTTRDLYTDVNAFLNVYYPVGRLFSCYYTFGYSVSLYLGLYDIQGPYIAGIAFLALAALALLIWIILSVPWLYNCCCSNCSNCCSSNCSGCCSGCSSSCSNCLAGCFDPCRTCKGSLQRTKERSDEKKIREAREEADRQNKINQELNDIEAQVIKPPSHIQLSENPDYVVVHNEDFLPPVVVENSAFADASAPPLTKSTFVPNIE